jgi:putative hydrolase
VGAARADDERAPAGSGVAARGDDLRHVEGRVADVDKAHRISHGGESRRERALGRLSTVAAMSDTPGGPNPPGQDPDDNNPFKGTPFEQFFASITGGLGGVGGPAGGGMPDLNALMSQMQSFFAPHDGPVNWETVTDVARRVAAQEPDPTPSTTQAGAIADAVRLADHWLDTTTGFPSGVSTTAAWSRADWIVETTDVWKVLVEPLAGSATDALSKALPEEMRQLAGPLIAMLGKASGAMVANQVGSGLGALAGDVLSASEIGLPLGPIGKAALLPTNVAAFAADVADVTADDVLLYLALREAAHQRLFAGVPWLRDHLIGAVAEYGAGMDYDTSGMEEKLRGFDVSNPQAMQEALAGGLFDPEPSPAQKAALEKLEVTLALVEGWVDEVVGQATAERMPAAAKLQENVRRRRAAGGPAEQTFATLVGLELRPRRLRDASTLWGSLRNRQGAEARDGVWMSPHLLPTAADLDDPLGFREDSIAPEELSAEDFDAGLRDLLDGDGDGGDSGTRPTE